MRSLPSSVKPKLVPHCAVMTRATRGHTGRALKVKPVIALAYLLIPAAMLVRVFGPETMPRFYNETVLVAGAPYQLTAAPDAVIELQRLEFPRAPVASTDVGDRTGE